MQNRESHVNDILDLLRKLKFQEKLYKNMETN